MNISFNFCLNNIVNSLNERIFRALTEKEQKVAIVAAVIFGGLVICCLVRHYCFNIKPYEKENEAVDVNQHTKKGGVGDDSKRTSQEIEKELDNKDIAKETVEKVDLVVKNEIQKVDSPKTSQDHDIEEKDDFTGIKAIEVIEAEEIEKTIEQEELPVYEPPVLLSFGKVRKGTGGGEPPNLMGMGIASREIVIDADKLYSAAFANCFHTIESHQEILKFLRKIRIDNDPLASVRGPLEHYIESYGRLYNNLVRLHEVLPGKREAKKIKIYWNDQAEKLLLPYFFMNENVEMDDLLFSYLSGEECHSSFQDPEIDFTCQVEFIGFEKNKHMDLMIKEIKRLAQSIFDQDFPVEELWGQESLEGFFKLDSVYYRALHNFRNCLLEAELSNKQDETNGLPKKSRKELEGLYQEVVKKFEKMLCS